MLEFCVVSAMRCEIGVYDSLRIW